MPLSVPKDRVRGDEFLLQHESVWNKESLPLTLDARKARMTEEAAAKEAARRVAAEEEEKRRNLVEEREERARWEEEARQKRYGATMVAALLQCRCSMFAMK